MRKFVIKNRQKRKYVRKTKVQSFSLSRTLYGMMPLIVIVITFMVTIVMLMPLRNSLTHIHITFQAPQISFQNPISFAQTLIQSVLQLGSDLKVAILTVYVLGMSAMDAFVNSVITTANNFWSNLIIALHWLTTAGILILQTIFQIGTTLISFIFRLSFSGQITTIHLFLSGIIFLLQIIEKSFFVLLDMLIATVLIVAHIITIASLVLFTTLLTISESVWVLLVTIFTAIASAFIYGLTAVIHVIEIPFKILYTLWLQIKPYIIMLGQHIQMSGSDFTNGLSSLEKVGTVLSSKK